MKVTDLAVFYHLGESLTYFSQNVNIGEPIVDLLLQIQSPTQWLNAFRSQTVELEEAFKDTRVVVDHFIRLLNDWNVSIPKDFTRTITQEEVQGIWFWKDKFEEAFEREQRNLSVFTVTPKGTRNTKILIDNPESDLPKNALPKLPKQFFYDLNQAARCLVFDLPTACVYHSCRATESLMIGYHEALTKKPWPYLKNRDWSAYIDHLVKQGADKAVADRLREIKDDDRNPYIHPDKNAELDEAKVLYNLCAGVNYYMAVQIERLVP